MLATGLLFTTLAAVLPTAAVSFTLGRGFAPQQTLAAESNRVIPLAAATRNYHDLGCSTSSCRARRKSRAVSKLGAVGRQNEGGAGGAAVEVVVEIKGGIKVRSSMSCGSCVSSSSESALTFDITDYQGYQKMLTRHVFQHEFAAGTAQQGLSCE